MSQGDLESRELMLDGRVAHMFTTTSFSADFGPEDFARQGAFLYPSKPGAKGGIARLQCTRPAGQVEAARTCKGHDRLPARACELRRISDPYRGRLGSDAGRRLDRPLSESHPNCPSERVPGDRPGVPKDWSHFHWILGPSPLSQILVATDIEKQIGDRLVVFDQSPEEVLEWANSVLQKALS